MCVARHQEFLYYTRKSQQFMTMWGSLRLAPTIHWAVKQSWQQQHRRVYLNRLAISIVKNNRSPKANHVHRAWNGQTTLYNHARYWIYTCTCGNYTCKSMHMGSHWRRDNLISNKWLYSLELLLLLRIHDLHSEWFRTGLPHGRALRRHLHGQWKLDSDVHAAQLHSSIHEQ